MEIVRLLLVVLHILGLALIIGPFLAQASRKAGFDTRLIQIGAIAQLVTGVLLVGVREAGDLGVDHTKVGVKLVVAVVVLVAAILAGRKQKAAATGRGPERAPLPLLHAAGGLAIVNVFIAVLWT
jgi:hypothetical protein